MRTFAWAAVSATGVFLLSNCGGTESTPKTTGVGGGLITGVGASSSGAGGMGGASPASASSSIASSSMMATTSTGGGGSGPGRSNIEHVIVVVQENHTFDAYFGHYCTAATGSNPTCTNGPACCETAPDKDKNGISPTVLDDTENAAYNPSHLQACELSEMNSGAMDRYTTGASCSDVRNFAIASDDVVAPYHDFATQYALADRYFQPIVGESTSNDMYFATAHYVFTDNAYKPDSNGKDCIFIANSISYTNKTTIADVVIQGGYDFAFYAEGYAAMLAATFCPLPPSDCPEHIPTNPCDYDPSDVPFEYYSQFTDDPLTMKDYGDFTTGVMNGSLPALSFVKPLGYHNEHPGFGTTVTAGATFVSNLVNSVLASPLADSTLILVTWDEGGGFFDHITPPMASSVDGQPYGTRIPLLAIGRFARTNTVSHVVMEHSSLLKFIELNFLGSTGQLHARDMVVANIGSMLDPAQTGIVVPEN